MSLMFRLSKSLPWWLAAVLILCSATQVLASSAKPGELDLLFTEKKKLFHSNGKLASIGELGTFRIMKVKKVKGKTKLVKVLKELPVGIWKSFWANGNKQTVDVYCNAFHAKQHVCKFCEKHGVYRSWYSDGKPRTQRSFSHGKLEGEVIAFYSTGRRQSVHRYKAGKREGRAEAWWSNGKSALEGSYKAGQRTGLWREFYSDGKLKYVKSYLNGKLNGTFVEYWSVCSPSGCFHRKMVQGFYNNGKKTGKWRYWDLQGTPTNESQWKIQYSN
jgi:antitoxin component YwqK of YwqJK toxin-antitoxin module